jgi:hypothetical protein
MDSDKLWKPSPTAFVDRKGPDDPAVLVPCERAELPISEAAYRAALPIFMDFGVNDAPFLGKPAGTVFLEGVDGDRDADGFRATARLLYNPAGWPRLKEMGAMDLVDYSPLLGQGSPLPDSAGHRGWDTSGEPWADGPETRDGICSRCGERRPVRLRVDPFVVEGIVDGPKVEEWVCRPCYELRNDDV